MSINIDDGDDPAKLGEVPFVTREKHADTTALYSALHATLFDLSKVMNSSRVFPMQHPTSPTSKTHKTNPLQSSHQSGLALLACSLPPLFWHY